MPHCHRALVLALVLSAFGTRVRAAATWEQETEARIALQSKTVSKTTGRPTQRHRANGGAEDGSQDDYIQRTAKELMKTVRPVADWQQGEAIGQFIDTYYFNVVEADYPGPQTVPIKDGKGNLIAMVTPGFWEHFRVEGTGRLLDGREINTSETGVIVVDAPMGEGTCRLKPWRTMAVDSKAIPLGTVVKIDETVGLRLPDGTVHDGYWQAEDTGGEVRNAHVDLYIGDGDKGGLTLDEAGIHLKALTIRYVETPAATCARP
jgi:hypothetical protein